jgi:hypothetical protein
MKSFSQVRHQRSSSKRASWARLQVELLEDRCLLSAFGNILVNNPAEDTTTRNTQSETSLVVFGSTIVAGFNDSGSSVGAANHFTGFARSTNGGASFTDSGTLPASTAGDAGDPSLARDQTSGTIYFATLGNSNSNVIQVFRSTDSGATFGAPINGAPGFDSTHIEDKEWITVDNAAGVGQGNVYLVFTDFSNSGFTDNGIYLTRSTNGGATWSTPLALGGSQGGYVTVGPEHTVYVFYWVSGPSQTIQMRNSTNQGVTFSSAVTVTSLVTTGVNGDLGLTTSNAPNSPSFRSNAFPQAVINSVSGNVYAIYNDKGAGTDKANIYFRQSSNAGTTWSAAVQINTDTTTTDQWQPTIAVTPDGAHLGVFWYDRSRDAANDSLIDRFGRIGTITHVNGVDTVTWSAEFRYSSRQFPPVFGVDGSVASNYMGDYDQTAADNTWFYSTWGDNRTVNPEQTTVAPEPNVRFAKIAVNGLQPDDTIGAFFPNADTNGLNIWALRNSNTGGVADIQFDYQNGSNQIPVVGDWNGNGIETIGVVFLNGGVNGQHHWVLRNSNSAGSPDIVFDYGNGNSVPVVGDWTGQGIDTIGVVYPDGGVGGQHLWELRNTNSAGSPDITVNGYGNGSSVMVVGDWTGQGKDTIGVVYLDGGVGGQHLWALRNSNTPGSADIIVNGYGNGNSIPVVGDWAGNGKDTIGVYYPNAGSPPQDYWALRNSNTPGNPDITPFYYGNDTQANYVYVTHTVGGIVGNWDGSRVSGVTAPLIAQSTLSSAPKQASIPPSFGYKFGTGLILFPAFTGASVLNNDSHALLADGMPGATGVIFQTEPFSIQIQPLTSSSVATPSNRSSARMDELWHRIGAPSLLKSDVFASSAHIFLADHNAADSLFASEDLLFLSLSSLRSVIRR